MSPASLSSAGKCWQACKMEKASIFDVPSRTFVCTDTGPSDRNTFEVTSDYLDFLLRFTSLYS